MKMKRLLTLSLAVAMTGGLVACTSNKNDSDSSSVPASNEAPAASASAPAASDQKYTITYYGASGWSPIQPSTSPGIDMINQKFNVDFKVQYVPTGEYAEKQSIRMAANDIPDLMDINPDQNFKQWAALGAFLPLDDYIDKYPSLKAVPSYVWDQLKINGHIYAIPKYFPSKYGKQPIIRQDWLDNLGLKMPTNYQELLQVADAFTKNDPDKNGKNDTYGLGLGKGIVYPNIFGSFWGTEWYQKNAQGQYIPGDVSEGSKERVQFLHDAYANGDIPKDWPTTDEGDVQKAFYAGKFGIWFEQLGKPQHYFDSLVEVNPGAKLSPVPAFAAPDGTQGFRGLRGFNGGFSLSAKLASDPGKADRILTMLDYSRKYYPQDQSNPQNVDFDWFNGKEGTGYTMVDGFANIPDENWSKGLLPAAYLDGAWVPADAKADPWKSTNPVQADLFNQMMDLASKSKFWIDPTFKISSPKLDKNYWPLYDNIVAEETKMIVGDDPIDKWDETMKAIFYDQGGQDIVDEVNEMLKQQGVEGEWVQ